MIVLCYHKICEVSTDWDGVITTPNTFVNQIEYLQSKFRFVTIEEALGDPREDSIILTFDDGAEDNYTIAYPIIKEYKIPTTFFVMTETLDEKVETWINELIWLMMECGAGKNKLELTICEKSFCFDMGNKENRESTYKELIRILVGVNLDTRNATMEIIRKWAGYKNQDKRTSHLMLSCEELVKLAQSDFVTIGAHTVTHRSLGLLSKEEQFNEINGSKERIENLIGKKIIHFAYPFGGMRDYSLQTVDILKALEIKYAFSTTYKRKSVEFSKYEIPRVCVSESSMEDFISKIEMYSQKESYYWNNY